MTRYAAPGTEGAIVSYQARYDHFIGGEYVPPARGQYFEKPSPVKGEPVTEVARGTAEGGERGPRAGRSTRRTGPPRGGAARRSPSVPTSCARSPTGWRRTSNRWRSPRAGRTASR